MKKTYKKPQIFVESFELAQHIAGCNLTLLDADVENCKASGTIGKWDNTSWFINKMNGCTVEPEEYCYTNGNFNIATINS